MLESGQYIGSFQIVAPLGTGATGLVYRAKHRHLGHEVAIKILRPELAQRADTASRFLAEARAINDIGHPNIVAVHDFAEDGDRVPPLFYMVMELLEGVSLGDHIHKAGFLPYDEALTIAGQVADALSAVHDSNRVHRDLKSDNIFLLPGDGGPTVKLLDFGLVKALDEELPQVRRTDPGTAVGTPAYMAPEQILEGGDIDQRTDIYALGVVLYEMLTGTLPFKSKRYGQLMVQVVKERPLPPTLHQEGIPRSVESIVLRCLEKKPIHRYQSAVDVSRAIAETGDGVESPVIIDAEPAEEDSPPLPEGASIGSYKVLRTIGKGGMGQVYLAIHESLQRKVALKLLRDEYAADADAVQRVFREALAASRINHPNIVAITDFIHDGDAACYVMEYLEGEPLIARLRRGMPLDEALAIAEQTADGLAALHEAGVIHRDLKPGNIFLVEREGQPVQVKLLDFGLAELSEEVTGGLEGGAPNPAMVTPEYCSPEQIRSPRTVDHRADIYTFGVVLYLMTVGRRPHEASTEDELLADISGTTPPSPSDRGVSLPRRLEQLIMSCLSIEPDGRPAAAKEVLEELRGIIRDRAAAGGRKRARGRLRWELAGLALVALVAGGYTWWQHRASPPPLPAPAARPADVAIASLKTTLRAVEHRARDKVAFAPARRGMDLHHLDAIKTGARSRAQVSFRAGGGLEVDEWTTVLIEAPGDDEELPVARLKKGTVHTEVRPGRALRVISPGGRESLIKASGDKPVRLRVRQRKDGLELAVLDGDARVTSAGRATTVGRGQFVDIGRGKMKASPLPPFPELLSPAVDATVTGSVVLRWHAVGVTKAFHVQLCRSHNFLDNIIDRHIKNKALVLEPGTLGPTRYVWRVSSIDGHGREGEFGYSRRFTVAAEPKAPSAEDFAPRDNKRVSVIKETAVVTFRWPPSVKGHTLLVTRGREVVARRRATGERVRVRLEPGRYRWRLVGKDREPVFRPARRLVLKRRTPPEVIPKVRWPGRKNP